MNRNHLLAGLGIILMVATSSCQFAAAKGRDSSANQLRRTTSGGVSPKDNIPSGIPRSGNFRMDVTFEESPTVSPDHPFAKVLVGGRQLRLIKTITVRNKSPYAAEIRGHVSVEGRIWEDLTEFVLSETKNPVALDCGTNTERRPGASDVAARLYAYILMPSAMKDFEAILASPNSSFSVLMDPDTQIDLGIFAESDALDEWIDAGKPTREPELVQRTASCHVACARLWPFDPMSPDDYLGEKKGFCSPARPLGLTDECHHLVDACAACKRAPSADCDTCYLREKYFASLVRGRYGFRSRCDGNGSSWEIKIENGQFRSGQLTEAMWLEVSPNSRFIDLSFVDPNDEDNLVDAGELPFVSYRSKILE